MTKLIEQLISKNALGPNTIITARYVVKGQLGPYFKTDEFKIQKIEKIKDQYYLLVKSILEDHFTKIMLHNVLLIDGMDPNRFIDVYDLNWDGSTKQLGKKRGRKTKAELAAG